jgi:general secretion pathway protein G
LPILENTRWAAVCYQCPVEPRRPTRRLRLAARTWIRTDDDVRDLGTTACRRARGLTYIELLVALSVLAVLASVALPLQRWTQRRRDEARLHTSLRIMRVAIDQYKKYSDEGLIQQKDVEQLGYPRKLEDLAEGVEVGDPQSPDRRRLKFLPRIPVDPFTGEARWGLRSYQDDWDARSWGGGNVYDVYSLSRGTALDGTAYQDW